MRKLTLPSGSRWSQTSRAQEGQFGAASAGATDSSSALPVGVARAPCRNDSDVSACTSSPNTVACVRCSRALLTMVARSRTDVTDSELDQAPERAVARREHRLTLALDPRVSEKVRRGACADDELRGDSPPGEPAREHQRARRAARVARDPAHGAPDHTT